jgi:hypothetical protein
MGRQYTTECNAECGYIWTDPAGRRSILRYTSVGILLSLWVPESLFLTTCVGFSRTFAIIWFPYAYLRTSDVVLKSHISPNDMAAMMTVFGSHSEIMRNVNTAFRCIWSEFWCATEYPALRPWNLLILPCQSILASCL